MSLSGLGVLIRYLSQATYIIGSHISFGYLILIKFMLTYQGRKPGQVLGAKVHFLQERYEKQSAHS